MRKVRFLLALVAVAALAACTAPTEDWSDPEWIQMRLEAFDPRAFMEFQQLSDEQKAELVPTIIDVYNEGLRQEDSLRALVSAGDPRARDVFMAALERSDDTLAGLAARGLGELEDTESSAAIARRLAQVTQHDAYPAFLEALAKVPTPQAADVIAELMQRPAQRIGGIGTVRGGCEILGSVENPSDAAIQALGFSLVNFIPTTGEDALNECERALIAQGDRSIPTLVAMLNGTNQAVNTHLTTLRQPLSVGQLRGGATLAHLNTPAAQTALIEWFNTKREIPRQELSRMEVGEQQNWYNQQGQLFTLAVEGLAIANTPQALETLRGLEKATPPNQEPETLLDNFVEWFQLSNGAEFGLRTSVHEALSQVGNTEDRALLWSRAEEGTVERGGAAFNRELRANALHFLGRTATAGEMEQYEAVLEAHEGAAALQQHRAYFVLAQQCGEDAACYEARLTDATPVLEEETIAAQLAAVEEGQARDLFAANVIANVRTAAVWQLASRLGEPGRLLNHLDHDSTQVRFNIARALLVTPELPADTATKINAFIEADADNTAGAARDVRNAYRLILAVRR